MTALRFGAALALALVVAGCGGGSSGTGGGGDPVAVAPPPSPAPAPPPPLPTAGCDGAAQPGRSASSATVTAARYLGGGAADSLNGAAVNSNCEVIVGGQVSGFTGTALSVAATPATATGLVLRLGPDGVTQLGAARFGTSVNDVALVPATNEVAVASDAGLAVLSPALDAVRWQATGSFARVAVGPDGTVAALGGASGKTLFVYNPSGSLRYSREFGDAMVNDVAVAGSGQAVRVAVTGMAQRDGGGCTQLQVAWVRAYDLNNASAWAAYDWSQTQAFNQNSSCADTRGYRLALGGDGKLYFAGESSGGNSIFRYGTLDLTANAPNVRTDSFNDPFNTGSNQITYLARLNPATGALEAGSFLLARLPNSRGNTIRPRALAADAAGTVYLGGISAAYIQNRQAISLNGTTLADYNGGDPWLLVLGGDFATRRAWLAFGNGGSGQVFGIGVNGSRVAIAAQATGKNATTGRALYTNDAAADWSGATAAYLAVLPPWR